MRRPRLNGKAIWLYQVLLLLLARLCILFAIQQSEEMGLYGLYVEKMVQHAQQAARSFNAGDKRLSKRHVQKATELYDKAIALFPGRPEAYMNHATFLFNIQKIDESIKTWKKALGVTENAKMLKDTERQGMVRSIRDRLKQAEYGLISKERDEVYNSGKGNLPKAFNLVRKQISMYDSPRLRHDKGTIGMMLSEKGENDNVDLADSVSTALNDFENGQRISIFSALKFERKLNLVRKAKTNRGYRGASTHVGGVVPKRDPKGCPRSSKIFSFEKLLKESKLLRDTRKENDSPIQVFETFDEDLFPWRLSDEAKAIYDRTFVLAGNSSATPTYSVGREGAASQFQAKNHGVVASMKHAIISGPDGILTSQKNCRLHIVKTSAWPFVPIHANLWIQETWVSNMSFNIYDHSLSRRYPPPGPDSNRLDKIAKAMTIVEFAGENFYHFFAHREIVLIHPKDHSRNRFITDLIGLVLADVIKDGAGNIKFFPYDTKNEMPGGRVAVQSLIFAVSSSIKHTVFPTTHCLVSSIWLQMSSIVFSNFKLLGTKNKPVAKDSDAATNANILNVVYVSRQLETSRKLENEDFKYFLKKLNTIRNVRVIKHEGGDSSIRKAISTFSVADAVVGVHGAGLSNILFCTPGTTLIEFGFTNPMSTHFEHVAKSLGITYIKKFIENRFEHGMSTGIVKISKETLHETVEFLDNMDRNKRRLYSEAVKEEL
eukprot:g7806.t1